MWIKQIDDLEVTVPIGRIAVSVTSPDFEDQEDILLGVVQSNSSKGVDQVEVVASPLFNIAKEAL